MRDKKMCAFYISLTVHLGIILVNNHLEALFSMYLFISLIYMFSSNPVLIIRRIELYQYIIWYTRRPSQKKCTERITYRIEYQMCGKVL
jgi:hypothetical protein